MAKLSWHTFAKDAFTTDDGSFCHDKHEVSRRSDTIEHWELVSSIIIGATSKCRAKALAQAIHDVIEQWRMK